MLNSIQALQLGKKGNGWATMFINIYYKGILLCKNMGFLFTSTAANPGFCKWLGDNVDQYIGATVIKKQGFLTDI